MRCLRTGTRFMWGIVIWACTVSDATLYTQALHEPDFDRAFSLCMRIASEQSQGDCAVAVMEHLHRREESDCQRLKPGLWQEECYFLYAERAAAEGRLREGFRACQRTDFGRECSFHLVRQGIRRVVALPPTEAADLLTAYQGLPYAPDLEFLFWKTYWRQRLEAGKAIEPNSCADEVCEVGARANVFELLEARRSNLVHTCEVWKQGGDVGGKSWARTELTEGWVQEWMTHNCPG